MIIVGDRVKSLIVGFEHVDFDTVALPTLSMLVSVSSSPCDVETAVLPSRLKFYQVSRHLKYAAGSKGWDDLAMRWKCMEAKSPVCRCSFRARVFSYNDPRLRTNVSY